MRNIPSNDEMSSRDCTEKYRSSTQIILSYTHDIRTGKFGARVSDKTLHPNIASLK